MVRRLVAPTALGLLVLASCIKEPFDPEKLGPPVFVNVTLLAPEPGELPWERESDHAVLWQAPDVPTPPSPLGAVSLSLDDGATWTPLPIPQIDLRQSRAIVRVPATGGTHLRVRVRLGEYAVDSGPIPIAPSRKRRYSFTRIGNDLPFGARDGMGGLVFNGRMFGIGGWNPILYKYGSINDVWSSTDGVTWSLVKPNTYQDPSTFDADADWSGRHFGGYAVHDGKMFLVGGDPVTVAQRDVWSSTDGVKWQNVTQESAYPLRVLHVTFAFNDRLWVVGGQTLHSTDTPTVFGDVWSSRDGATWERSAAAPSPRWGERGIIGGNAVFRGRMWLVAGGIYEQEGFRPERTEYDDVWSSADGTSWTRELSHTPFRPRYYHNVEVFDDRLWVLGGHGSGYVLGAEGNLPDVHYSSDGRNWYALDAVPGLAGRHAATAWVHNGALYWGSGNAVDDSGKWVADMWKITPLP